MNLDDLRNDYDIVPIVRELSADAITPVAAFAALSGDGEAFLLESVERGENVGRYSFVGFEPRRSLRFDENTPDPVSVLNNELRPLRVYREDTLPPFFGGAVGFFGYSVAGWSERIPDSHPNNCGIPDARLLFFDNVVVFDHVKQRLYVIPSRALVVARQGSLAPGFSDEEFLGRLLGGGSAPESPGPRE